jgi:hypothetical protein
MMKTKTKGGGSAAAEFLQRAFNPSVRSAAERKAMLETRRNILKKLLVRQNNAKSGQL